MNGVPALVSAFVKISFSSRKWGETLFAAQKAVRVNTNRADSPNRRSFTALNTIPLFPIIRLRKISRVTRLRSNQVDTNTAQSCYKLKINFHYPRIKSLLIRMDWSSLGYPFICNDYVWLDLNIIPEKPIRWIISLDSQKTFFKVREWTKKSKNAATWPSTVFRIFNFTNWFYRTITYMTSMSVTDVKDKLSWWQL